MGDDPQRWPVRRYRRGLRLVQAQSPAASAIGTAAGYAAMGAFYFLVSAVSLTVKGSGTSPSGVPVNSFADGDTGPTT
jgi:hypothetical protein